MPDPIDVVPGVRIPAAALEARGVRSGGPGGQNVNKVASKAELFVDLALVEGLDDEARARLLALAEGRRDADGFLRLTAGESRDFHRNLETARAKARALAPRAPVVPPKRRAARPAARARQAPPPRQKRLAKLKRNRARPRGEE